MSAFRTRVTGDARTAIDEDELRRGCGVLFDPASHIEVFSVLPGGRGAVGNIVKAEPDAIIEATRNLPAGMGTYWCINPVKPITSGRPKVGDITRRYWFLIDVDPKKDPEHAHDSASDPERYDARDVALMAMGWLTEQDWPLPVILDSGNGTQLLYRIDLPNDNMSRALIAAATKKIAQHFADLPAIIDTSTAKANQGAKLPGTWARKGLHSDDRPHRQARLIEIPHPVEVVPAEYIAALAGKQAPTGQESGQLPDRKADSNGHGSALKVRTTTDDRSRAYAEKALLNECAILRNTTQMREVCLARAAFVVGQVLHLGLLRNKAEGDLEAAAWSCGLRDDPNCGERHIRDTITRQLNAGESSPRELPNESNGAPVKITEPVKNYQPPEKLTICGADVVPKTVDWFWSLRIPKRFVTVFAGRTGLGKSFVLCDVIARMTNAGEVPEGNGECFEQGNALFISEDPHDYMLAPRLIEAGADMHRVHFMTWEAMAHYQLSDTEYLERAWEETGRPKLIVIDPPSNFVGDADSHKDTEVRQIIMRIVSWLTQDEHDVAVVFILHVNKQTGKGVEALNRVMGSVAWTTTARIAHTFASDPDRPDVNLFVPMKSNVGPLAKGLAYQFKKTDNLAVIEWLGEIDTTADEAMAGMKGKPRRVTASEWLIEQFQESREWKSSVLFDAAAQENISRDAIFEAKRILKLPRAKKVTEQNGDVHWLWWVPIDWEYFDRDDEENSTVAD